MLDLHQGILEVFAEAQEGAGFAGTEARFLGARAEYVRARAIEYKRRAKPRWDAQIWSNRRAAAATAIQPLAVQIITCPRCAKPVELRAGCSRPTAHRCRS